MVVRVASLLRLSTRKQARRQGDGEPDIPAQRQAVAEFIGGRSDWVHVREYQEAGVSAFKVSADSRDVLQDALRDAAAGEWSVLVVFKADRLSRNSTEYPLVLARLRRAGAEVWSVADGPGGKRLGLESQTDKFIRFLEGWQAETESVNTQVRVAARMRQLAREGRWCGGKVPFGYELAAVRDERGEPLVQGGRAVRRLVPHPEYGPVVREIFLRYVGGEGNLAIAAWLNRRGIPTYHGRTWSAETVRTLLTNPLYAGRIAYGRRPGSAGGAAVAADGQHPALVEPELFDRAILVRLQKRGISPRQRAETYPLTGAIRCGLCGGRLGGISRRRGGAGAAGSGVGARASSDTARRGYRCLSRTQRRACRLPELQAERLESAFLAELESLGRPSRLRTLLEQVQLEQERSAEAGEAARAEARAELERAEAALERLDRAYLEAGALTLAEYREKRSHYLERRSELNELLETARPPASAVDLDGLWRLAGEIRENWAAMTPAERKLFVLNLTQAHGLTALAHPDGRVELRPAGAGGTERPEAGRG